MIDSIDPIALPLCAVALYAAAMYPLGLIFGAECSLCCCRLCNAEEGECCGSEWPRAVGECCDNEWRTDEGVCCDDQWQTGEGVCCGDEWQTGEGVCCDDQWQTGEGVCCGGEWQTGEGVCCNQVWYPDANPCPEGQVFINNSETCCGCMADEVYDPETEEMVPTLDNLTLVECPGCNLDDFPYTRFTPEGVDRGPMGRCCLPGGVCQYEVEADCNELNGEWDELCCTDLPQCEVACCREDGDGVASCEAVPKNECQLPDTIHGGEADCETACKGACCVDGESVGNLSQAECDAAGGCWAGVGSTECIEPTSCRPPFDANCCESVVSGASGLTFTQPRRKRCEPTVSPWLVTVTGTTDSEITIHGVPVGVTATPTKRCPINVAFLVCWDKFNIEPMPCDSEFRRLDVSVCWTPAEDDDSYNEVLNYSGCDDISLWLGDCSRDCETTLAYAGPGVTVGATVEVRGDATIQANGGALVFPSAFNYAAGCNLTLTLDGTSTAENSIAELADPNNTNTLSLRKTGPGLWKLTAASTFTGTSAILDGTIVVAVSTSAGGSAGAFGITNDLTQAGRPLLGNSSSGVSGSAALLLTQNTVFTKRIQVASQGEGSTQVAILGGANTTGTSTFGAQSEFIYLGRDVTFQAATGGTVEFLNRWTDGTGNAPIDTTDVNITVGTSGNAGTVVVAHTLNTSGSVTVSFGTLRVTDGLGYLQADLGVTIDGSTAELSYHSALPLVSPVSLEAGTLSGDATINAVSIENTPTVRVDSGEELVIDDELSGTGTLTKTGDGTLRITGSSTFSGTLNITAGEVVVEQIVTNPGGLATAATFAATTLSVAFAGDPATGDEYVLLAGPTQQSYTPTLTGTTMTGTYDAATATLTIN